MSMMMSQILKYVDSPKKKKNRNINILRTKHSFFFKLKIIDYKFRLYYGKK